MSDTKPYFVCQVTLEEQPDGTYDLVITTRNGTIECLHGFPFEVARRATAAQAVGSDVIDVTIGPELPLTPSA